MQGSGQQVPDAPISGAQERLYASDGIHHRGAIRIAVCPIFHLHRQTDSHEFPVNSVRLDHQTH